MKAIVVYELLWGNTAAIARAIAEGIGPQARALSTAEASGTAIADVDLIVAGAPVQGFRLPTDKMRESIRKNPGRGAPTPPDLSHPSMRSWLDALPEGQGCFAAFETRIWWSPRGATSAIISRLKLARVTAPWGSRSASASRGSTAPCATASWNERGRGERSSRRQ